MDALSWGPARRRRQMRRALAELDHIDSVPPSWEHGGHAGGYPGGGYGVRWTAPAPRSSHAPPLSAAGRAFAVLLLVGAGFTLFSFDQVGRSPLDLFRRASGDLPPEAFDGEGYAFLHTQPSSPTVPVTYDPCHPVRIALNPAHAPEGGREVTEDAIFEVSQATGLDFELTDDTDERPASGRPLSDSARYGQGYSPILVAWSDPVETPRLAGDVAGLGGSVPLGGAFGTSWLVTGHATLDAPDFERLLSGHDGRDRARAIVMHELAHVVGLDHVDDPDQLMYADNVGRTRWGIGDLAGLRLLGAGPCS